MPEGNEINFVLGLINALILLASILILSITLKDNRNFHKQKLLYYLITDERELKIKLNIYLDKLDKVRSREKEDEIWKDYDNLLFAFYEHLAILIIKDMVNENDLKPYFKPLLRDVYETFYYDTGIFDERKGPFRKDYPYLVMLFKKWDMKAICDSLYSEDRNK